MSAIRKAIFAGYYIGTGRAKVLRDVDRLEATFQASRHEIEILAKRRLAEILNHAAATVPFYQERLKSRTISPDTAHAVLRELPILTKSMIRAEGKNLFSSRPGPKPRWNTSGGSTGEPLRLMQDRDMARESRTGELLYLRWAGQQLGDPHLLVWGVPQATFSEGVSFHEHLFRFACNETYYNCYGITDALMDEWIAGIQRLRPTVIEAYVDAAYELSKRILATGVQVPSPRGMIVSAGVLTEAARESIAGAFKAPILNRYGSREVGNVACSCGRSGLLHVNEGWAHLEIVDDAGRECAPGVEGDVLVTLFANRTMPLLRYRIEDRATWSTEQCPCGRATRMLAAVNGRMTDFLVGSDGIRISGSALPTLLYSTPGIRQYQFRQKVAGHVVLAVVPGSGADEQQLKGALEIPANKLRALLRNVRLEIEVVPEIPPSNSGKYRYILNEVGRS